MSKFGQLIHEALHSPQSNRLEEFAQVLRKEPEYKQITLTSKMWLLPDGTVQPLDGELHDQWLQNHHLVAQKFGISDEDLFGDTADHQTVRIAALKRGFVRIVYERGTGALTVEALHKYYNSQARSAIFMLVADNAEMIDRMTVNLLDDTATKLMSTRSENLFNYDDKEKLNHLPESSESMRFRYVVYLAG